MDGVRAAVNNTGASQREGQPVPVDVPQLDVAGARIGPLAVIVHALFADGRSVAADGLLGRDVLDAFTLTVDPVAGRATLTPR